MHDTDGSRARERACLATISTIADLALDDLPDVARLVLATSSVARDDAERRDLLVRAYDLAFDAGQEYLAELLDLAIAQLSPSPVS